jgi:hypothetical protein
MRRLSTHLGVVTGLIALAAAFGACAIGGGTGGATTGGPTPTATPIPCSTRATTTATVWNESDKQIHGSIGGAAPTVLSNFHYPLGLPDESFEAATETLGRMTVSPDGHHIGVIVDVYVPNARDFYPYVVDTTTHAVTRVGTLGDANPSNNEPRQLTWVDNQTLLVFPGIRGVPSTDAAYSYNITTAAVTPLPGLTGVVEGVARCGVLFYMDFTDRTTYSDADHTRVFNERIHRYNLASHTEIGSPLTIGDAFTWGGAEGDIYYPGWDVARDGSRLAWQHAAVATGQVITSTFQSANADGSGLGAILTGPPAATAHSMAALAISADGSLVAVTGAAPSPTVVTGPITGGGGIRYYTPDTGAPPVWLPDGSGLLAGGDDFTPGLNQYLLSAPLDGSGRAHGTVAHATGYYPATLP